MVGVLKLKSDYDPVPDLYLPGYYLPVGLAWSALPPEPEPEPEQQAVSCSAPAVGLSQRRLSDSVRETPPRSGALQLTEWRMALEGCRILVLGTGVRLPADCLGAVVSLNGAPALEARSLTHLVAADWDAVVSHAPSLARRHDPAQPDGPLPPGTRPPLFVRPQWLEESLRTARCMPGGAYEFAPGQRGRVRRRSSDDAEEVAADPGRPHQRQRCTQRPSAAAAAAPAAAPPSTTRAVSMVRPSSVSSSFHHRHGATVDCRQLTPSRAWGIAEGELGVWFSQPPPLVDTSRPQPIAAFDFDNTVATCDNTKGHASDWTFRKDR